MIGPTTKTLAKENSVTIIYYKEKKEVFSQVWYMSACVSAVASGLNTR